MARSHGADYFTLTKPGITLMVVLTTLMAYLLASQGSVDTGRLVLTLVGTAFCSGGANALNMLMERSTDALMFRTRSRPIPAGRLSGPQALSFGIGLSVVGVILLLGGVNVLTGLLAVVSILFYLMAYTPLKRKTWLCVGVGALPGAVPPLMGWAAVENGIGMGGWFLFAILFIWQFPHFMALSWMYREDYARAGLPMLSVVDRSGKWVAVVGLVFLVGLAGVTMFPQVSVGSSMVFGMGVGLLDGMFLVAGLAFAIQRTTARARMLFLASVTYLPVTLGLVAAQASHLLG